MRPHEVMFPAVMAVDKAREIYHRAIVEDAPDAMLEASRARLVRAHRILARAVDWVEAGSGLA